MYTYSHTLYIIHVLVHERPVNRSFMDKYMRFFLTSAVALLRLLTAFTRPLQYKCISWLQGISVETVCSMLRSIPALRLLASNHTLVMLCDIKTEDTDAIQVAIVSQVFFNNHAKLQVSTTVIS